MNRNKTDLLLLTILFLLVLAIAFAVHFVYILITTGEIYIWESPLISSISLIMSIMVMIYNRRNEKEADIWNNENNQDDVQK